MIVNEIGLMREEMTEAIADVKTTVLQVKEELSKEMKAVGDKVTEVGRRMDAGFADVVETVRTESTRVYDKVVQVQADVHQMKADLTALMNKHHFEDKVTACDAYASAIESRHTSWRTKMMFSQQKLRYALWASSDTDKSKYLRDAKAIMDQFLSENEQSESVIARDATQLLNCITQGGDVFTRLADHLRSNTAMTPREKIWTMNAQLSRYIGVFAMSEAVATARFIQTEFTQNHKPLYIIVLTKIAAQQLRLSKLYKTFWNAVNSMFQCPVCKARGIYRRREGVVISANDRPGKGCNDVDSIVSGYYGVKASNNAYNPAIASFAKTFPARNRYSSSQTFCGIHSYYGWKWRGGCWGDNMGRTTVYYTHHTTAYSTHWCSGW